MLACYVAASEENYIFRQFRYLRSRVLLHLQDDLRSLEVRLWEMDDYDRTHRPKLPKSRQMDDESIGERGKLIERIRDKLLNYGQSHRKITRKRRIV